MIFLPDKIGLGRFPDDQPQNKRSDTVLRSERPSGENLTNTPCNPLKSLDSEK
jgi:hypothetical protein